VTENRESFFNRLEPFLAPSVLLDVQHAYTLAKYGHRAQVRKELDTSGEPIRYFEHVRRVAIVLVDEVKIVKSEMLVAALMHDIIEDAPNLPPALIEHCFGTDVVSIIKTLSKAPKEGYLDRFHMCTDWRPYVIKACDRLDNLRSLGSATKQFRAKQVQETRCKYYGLFNRMLDLTPPEYLPRVKVLNQAITEETVRQATLLESVSGL
jgi:GTP pyrophosphokinase